MKTALIISVFIKVFGSLFEIVNQILITRFGGVSLFGEYSFYIALIDIICWVIFSGIVKTNAFYISNGKDIRSFHKRFYFLLALPLVILSTLVLGHYSVFLSIVVIGAYLYGIQMNLSSILLAHGKYRVSLFGEYLLSRVTIFILVLVLISTNTLSAFALVLSYSIGFLVSVTFFLIKCHDINHEGTVLTQLEKKKLIRRRVNYQLTDVANGLITQLPMIVQYLFAGAFNAGVLSVVLVARKLINFIGGPAVKVYLPDFAKRWSSRDIFGLKKSYREVVLLQMCFILPVSLILIASPEAILAIYSPELEPYTDYLQFAALVFLFMVMFGPQGNLLSMAEQESKETWTKWLSLAAMIGVMALTSHDEKFVLYGIAAQALVDALLKYGAVCKTLQGAPIKVSDWLILFIPFALLVYILTSLSLDTTEQLLCSCLGAIVLCVFESLVFFRSQISNKAKRIIHRT